MFQSGESFKEIEITIIDNPHSNVELLGADSAIFIGKFLLTKARGAQFPGDNPTNPDPNHFLEIYLGVLDNELPRSSTNAPPILLPSVASVVPGLTTSVKVPIRRTGSTALPLTVNVSSSDLTAFAGVHFVRRTNTLTFAPLQVEVPLSIPILPARFITRELTLELSVSGVEGGINWRTNGPLRLVDATRPGTVDSTFEGGYVSGGLPLTGGSYIIEDVIPLPDGRMYIGGHLDWVQSVRRDGIARLLQDGTLDTSFGVQSEEFTLNGDTHRLLLQPDGRLIAGYYRAFRFHNDGSGDSSFMSPARTIVGLLPDGKMLGYTNDSKLVRFKLDGSVDSSFASSIVVGYQEDVVIEPDGKIVLLQTSDTADLLVRLQPDGHLDATLARFARGESPRVVRQADGKYILFGYFRYNQEPNYRFLARIHRDGGLDSGFQIDPNLFLVDGGFVNNDLVRNVLPQSDGKILVAGKFGFPRSISKGGLLRLNSDGSLDPTFDVGTGAGVRQTDSMVPSVGEVHRVVLQPDRQLLVLGNFTDWDGLPRSHMVRLNGDGRARDLRLGVPTMASAGEIKLPLLAGSTTNAPIRIEATDSLTAPNWQTIQLLPKVEWATEVIIPNLGSERRFYRAVSVSGD